MADDRNDTILLSQRCQIWISLTGCVWSPACLRANTVGIPALITVLDTSQSLVVTLVVSARPVPAHPALLTDRIQSGGSCEAAESWRREAHHRFLTGCLVRPELCWFGRLFFYPCCCASVPRLSRLINNQKLLSSSSSNVGRDKPT